ncbi:16S rRNA (adenine(1518)-N(6)/adenine(1519)-N(6))-dimethyltransferase RsmA [Thiohalorhabdus methylotrophus]|uniref:Ribosomal RNA small subunit methyltransferase A n=1 Tax=Thiohalorhabdus methylotrophus TaxID=3242694 RepID=A0ABV4U034_9GAMM
MQKHRPRKRFGQNFLHDGNIAGKIVAALDPGADDRVVEIGPGQGALTRLLLAQLDRLDAIELDRDLIPGLAGLPGAERLHVHEADALDFDFAGLAAERGGPLRVAGNLPYNISTPLLFHLLAHPDAIRDMFFMLQREVVDRLAAAPGTKTYGRLSVMAQVDCAVTPLFRVPPGAFYPVPQVESAVVHLRLRPGNAPRDRARFEEVVARAFQARRKTLRNALRGLCDPSCLEAAAIDPHIRAEMLTVDDFIRLADQAAGAGGPEATAES